MLKRKEQVRTNVVLVKVEILECNPPYEGDVTWLVEQVKREQETSGGIGDTGMLLPLIVRPLPNGHYQVTDGKKRVKAAPALQLSKLPVLILEIPYANEELAYFATNSSQRQWDESHRPCAMVGVRPQGLRKAVPTYTQRRQPQKQAAESLLHILRIRGASI